MATMAAVLIGPAAVLVPEASLFAPEKAAASAPVFDPVPLESSFVPDPPPPRA
jgi:hypothetical protein